MADPASVTDHAIAPQDAASETGPRRPLLPRVIGTRRASLLAAGALALTGLIFASQAALLDLGHIGLPGPGFFPLVLGGLLVFLSALIAIESRLASFKDEPLEFGHPQVLITFAALLAVPLLFEIELVGAYITLGLLSAVLLVLIARVSVLLAVVCSAIGMAACWYLFGELLGVRLPTGPF
jgi:hypothetical protein